ncbi:MAG TPA: hypothetical protein VFO55_00120 [Gemmatimonadaceae bacterium]|nr:hypothetical protein [Gemmatimonadaceae bacterium]
MKRSRIPIPAALAALLVPAVLAGAQQTGTLVVSLTGQAGADPSTRLQVAVVTADSTSRPVRIDSVAEGGAIRLARVPAGRYRVETRVLGFVPDTSFVVIEPGKTASLSLDLARVTALDPVTVAGTNQGHLTGFQKRRLSGKGTFLTRDEIEKSRRNSIPEVLRAVRGLRVECAGTCSVHMVRSTNCQPRYFANGFPSDASILQTPVLDVAGIEIYRGPSETPGEFLGAQSMCGAIVIWIK